MRSKSLSKTFSEQWDGQTVHLLKKHTHVHAHTYTLMLTHAHLKWVPNNYLSCSKIKIKEVPLSLENGMQTSKLIVSEREWVVKNNKIIIIIIKTSLYFLYSCSNITLWGITKVFDCSKLLSMWGKFHIYQLRKGNNQNLYMVIIWINNCQRWTPFTYKLKWFMDSREKSASFWLFRKSN